MAQMAFYQDMTECTGCRCCQVACKDKHDLEIGYFFRKATDYEGGEFPNMWSATLSMGCNHCDTPACFAACPVGAIFKEEEYGFVIIDEDKCDGCQACVEACPYDAPEYIPEKNKVYKCDGCIDWIKNGMQPACVGACSTRCLKFGEEEEILAEYPDATNEISVLPAADMTSPNFYMKPKPDIA